jgi:hypothetical protein
MLAVPVKILLLPLRKNQVFTQKKHYVSNNLPKNFAKKTSSSILQSCGTAAV